MFALNDTPQSKTINRSPGTGSGLASQMTTAIDFSFNLYAPIPTDEEWQRLYPSMLIDFHPLDSVDIHHLKIGNIVLVTSPRIQQTLGASKWQNCFSRDMPMYSKFFLNANSFEVEWRSASSDADGYSVTMYFIYMGQDSIPSMRELVSLKEAICFTLATDKFCKHITVDIPKTADGVVELPTRLQPINLHYDPTVLLVNIEGTKSSAFLGILRIRCTVNTVEQWTTKQYVWPGLSGGEQASGQFSFAMSSQMRYSLLSLRPLLNHVLCHNDDEKLLYRHVLFPQYLLRHWSTHFFCRQPFVEENEVVSLSSGWAIANDGLPTLGQAHIVSIDPSWTGISNLNKSVNKVASVAVYSKGLNGQFVRKTNSPPAFVGGFCASLLGYVLFRFF
jgi:hypothetical protein